MSTENDTSSEDNASNPVNEGRLQATISREYLSEYIDAVQPIVDECRLHVNEDGFRVAAVDPANVAMVEAELDAEAFKAYDAAETTLGVPIYKLQNLLEYFPDAAEINLNLLNAAGKLKLTAGPYTYTLELIEPEKLRSPPNIPSLDMTAEVTLDRDKFYNAIGYFDEFGQHVAIGFNSASNQFWMESSEKGGEDRGDFVLSESEFESVLKGESARSKYSLDYMRDFEDGSPGYGLVTVRTGDEVPLKLYQQIVPEQLGPAESVFRGEVLYVLAPRMEDN